MSLPEPPSPPTLACCPPPAFYSSHMQLQPFPHQVWHWHTSVLWCPILLPLLGKAYFPRPSYSPTLSINYNSVLSLYGLPISFLFVHTTTPAQKPVSMSALVMSETFPPFHCHSHKVCNFPTLCLFWGLNKYPGLPDGRVDREEFRRNSAQVSLDNTPSFPAPQPYFWA